MWDVRTITEDQALAFRQSVSTGFGSDFDSDPEAGQRFSRIFEYDRTFGVFEEGEVVGTASAFSLELTVPGGRAVPMGGTTVVTVQPTHRRRGVLRAMMAAHLQDVADHAEPLAGLWASESTIYGRFGFGPATYHSRMSLDARHASVTVADSGGEVRLVGGDRARTMLPPIYEDSRARDAGMLSRSEAWWTYRVLADPDHWRGGASANRYAVHFTGGRPDGYAIYRQKSEWTGGLADGEVRVTEVVSGDESARAGLWRFLANIDLFPRVEWWNLPVDDALHLMVSDPRRMVRNTSDGLWVRIMDVPGALTARRYVGDGNLVLEVKDETLPDVAGTFRLEVSGGEAHCERVELSADVTLDTAVLGRLYLGGTSAIGLAAAGLVEGTREAITGLHRLFRTDVAPWCPYVF